MSKSLFILKRREDYSSDPSYSGSFQIATGMWNSAKFVVDELQANGREAGIAIVQDANSIDAAIMGYMGADDPADCYVFIEGLWVVPSKFTELMALPRHAGRNWVVRVHSEIPFLASESVALGWISEYLTLGVNVAPNAPRALQQIEWMRDHLVAPATGAVTYLPNCYPRTFQPLVPYVDKPTIDIACFGAFRLLKNHVQQAFVALRFAESIGKTLNFHVNTHISAGGAAPAKNVTDLFAAVGATVIEHEWEDRETFLQSLADIDILLQVSMSETFNIVAADAVLVGKPILVSNEIPWAYPLTADPQNVDDCLAKMKAAWAAKTFFIQKNRIGLKRYSEESTRKWLGYLPSSA